MASSLCFYSDLKIRFFNQVRRFLRSKASRRRFRMKSDSFDILINEVWESREGIRIRNYDPASVLRTTVKSLHFGDSEEKQMAVKDIEMLIKVKEDDVKFRKLMVDLGVIPALVSMVDSDQLVTRETMHVALKVLVELSKDSFENKSLMVEEGILSKLPNNTQSIAMDSSIHEFAQLLSSLSTLANTQLFLASTESIISFLLTILNSESSTNTNTQSYCLPTLFNISTVLENAESLISNGVIPTLLRFSSVKEFSEKALPTLGNLMMTPRGKKSLENDPTFPEILIDILTWEEKPKCQEQSAYIIMILAHQSSAAQRERLAKSGIIQALLELALLGSPLAQKRAMKLLQWFKNERQARIEPHSGPQNGSVAVDSAFNEKEIEKGKKMMRNLVKQSLYKNMEMITRRANAGSCSESDIRSLVSSRSSKSLPY